MDHPDDFSRYLYFVLAACQDAIEPPGPTGGAHLKALPQLAANHFASAVDAAAMANAAGRHAFALGLARHAFESLTIIELNPLDTPDSWNQLVRWEEGKRTAGELRKWLTESAWSGYRPGLFGEPWPDFASTLGRALQPYAHFSPELLQWNLSIVAADEKGHPRLAGIGPQFFDEDKATRLEVLRGVLLWSLGTLLVHHVGPSSEVTSVKTVLGSLARGLVASDWLVGDADWVTNLIPHVLSIG